LWFNHFIPGYHPIEIAQIISQKYVGGFFPSDCFKAVLMRRKSGFEIGNPMFPMMPFFLFSLISIARINAEVP